MSRKTYRKYGSVKSSERVLNQVFGHSVSREGREYIAFASWHRSRFRDNIIFRPEIRRLIAAYRFYLKQKIAKNNGNCAGSTRG